MKHLTAADRGRIEVLLKLKHTNTEVGRLLGRHKTTIGREVTKGTNQLGAYSAEYAQWQYQQHRRLSYNTPKLTRHNQLGDYVIDRIKAGWDPSQIAGRLKATQVTPRVCTETIYAWVYNSPTNQATALYQYLRYGKKKRGRQRIAERTRQQFKLPNRVSIHDRPTVVRERTRLGDWEGDTVVYPNKQLIISAYERTSSYGLFAQVPTKQTRVVCAVLGRLLATTDTPRTLTLDNGVEFYHHHRVTEASGATVYFADPYASYQRGGNENLNRQLRAYLPKRTDITDLTPNELIAIQDELNYKPRKRLNWHTPVEVYGWLVSHPENTLELEKVAFEGRS